MSPPSLRSIGGIPSGLWFRAVKKFNLICNIINCYINIIKSRPIVKQSHNFRYISASESSSRDACRKYLLNASAFSKSSVRILSSSSSGGIALPTSLFLYSCLIRDYLCFGLSLESEARKAYFFSFSRLLAVSIFSWYSLLILLKESQCSESWYCLALLNALNICCLSQRSSFVYQLLSQGRMVTCLFGIAYLAAFKIFFIYVVTNCMYVITFKTFSPLVVI